MRAYNPSKDFVFIGYMYLGLKINVNIEIRKSAVFSVFRAALLFPLCGREGPGGHVPGNHTF